MFKLKTLREAKDSILQQMEDGWNSDSFDIPTNRYVILAFEKLIESLGAKQVLTIGPTTHVYVYW